MSFLKALGAVLEIEGNYVNDKRDAGKETYRGISRHFHPNWDGWDIVDLAKGCNNGISYLKKGDVTLLLGSAYQLKLDQLVSRFYLEEFWNKIRGDEIEKIAGFKVAVYTFDTQVNPTYNINGAKLLQIAINKECDACLRVDGEIGEKSLRALTEIKNYKKLLTLMQKYRAFFYVKQVRINPKDIVYLEGWIDRALEIA